MTLRGHRLIIKEADQLKMSVLLLGRMSGYFIQGYLWDKRPEAIA